MMMIMMATQANHSVINFLMNSLLQIDQFTFFKNSRDQNW